MNLSRELSVVITAALPLTELRAAIPLALFAYHFSLAKSIFLAVLGNMVPVIFLLELLGPVSSFLSKKSRFAKRFFDWLFAHTREKFSRSYELYGSLALVAFVAIPLPGFGVWTGSAAAWLFGFRKMKSYLLIFLGVLLMAAIVTVLSVGVQDIFSLK